MPLPYCIEWLDEAKADVRRLDRPTAMRIFEAFFTMPALAAAMSNHCTAIWPAPSASDSATTACSLICRTMSSASSASVTAAKLTAERLKEKPFLGTSAVRQVSWPSGCFG